MKNLFLFTLIIILSTSCKQKTESQQTVNNPAEIPTWETELDTILERNNPKNLDLTRHQLFIDTTRNSDFYKHYHNWKRNGLENEDLSALLADMSEKQPMEKVSLGDFPKLWISLKKFNDEFVIYQPCDGNTASFEITESAVIFHYQIESDVEQISKLTEVDKNTIQLELNVMPQKSNTEKSRLTIKPTEIKNVYKLTHGTENDKHEYFVTPRENVVDFDLVINNCPEFKVNEYNGFDN